MATNHELSLNPVMQKVPEAEANRAEESRLYEVFSLLGAEAQEVEVEFALPAQQEVVMGEMHPPFLAAPPPVC